MQNASRCDELVAIALFGISVLNMVVKSVSCQLADLLDLYRNIGSRKSILRGRNENIQGKCIPSAFESVYRESFVPHREKVKLP